MHQIIAPIVALAAFAAPDAAVAEMITAQNPQQIAKLLQKEGYKAQLDKDSDGDPVIHSGASGSKFSIYFYGCTNHADCRTVQFGSGYAIKDKKARPTLEKINEWNHKHRFGRAYLDKDQDPNIEMDVNLDEGGISSALFMDHIGVWTAIMGQFPAFAGIHGFVLDLF